jgi:hypothetical protein
MRHPIQMPVPPALFIVIAIALACDLGNLPKLLHPAATPAAQPQQA